MANFSTCPKISRQTSDDLIRLFSAEISAEELDLIIRRKSESGQYREEMRMTSHLLSELNALANDEEILALLDDTVEDEVHRVDIPTSNLSGRVGALFQPMLTAAAMALFCIFLVIDWNPGVFESKAIEVVDTYLSGKGQQREVSLEDGSLVVLNTNSEIRVTYSDSYRMVELVRGEAFFDVSKDPGRPFQVLLGGRAISVLGTQFYVRRTNQRLALMVEEGAVALHQATRGLRPKELELQAVNGLAEKCDDNLPYIARPGVVVECGLVGDRVVVRDASGDTLFGSWRSGMIRFDDRTLSDVVNELNRYSDKEIVIRNSAIRNYRIYAVVSLDSLERAVKCLEYSLPIRVRVSGNQIVLDGKE